MPTYQYSCTDCGHFFEAVQSFSDDSLTQCPECEGRLRKVFNAVGVVFKGSGFYRNDSRSGSGSSGSSEKASTDKSTTDKSTSEKSAPKTGEKVAGSGGAGSSSTSGTTSTASSGSTAS